MSMLFNMVRSTIGTKHKIFNSIISRLIISMMNMFSSFKIPFKIFLHYKTMFINIFSSITKWMFRFINKNIATSRFSSSTTFPIWAFITKKFAFYLRFAYFITPSDFIFSWLTFFEGIRTFTRTKITLICSKYKSCQFKIFMAIKAFTYKFGSLFFNNNLFHIHIIN